MVQETPKGVAKIYGHVSGGYESLTSNFEFITITTAIDIRPIATGTFKSQACLDKLIEIVSLRGQPVIMGLIGGVASPFSLLLAIEHPMGWFCAAQSAPAGAYLTDPRANEDLKSRIIADGVNFGFGANVSVTVANPATGAVITETLNDTAVLAVTFSGTLV